MCGILNISCTSDDATNDAENKGYREFGNNYLQKIELLSELEKTAQLSLLMIGFVNLTGMQVLMMQPNIMLENPTEWMFYPQYGYPYNWKASLAFDQFRCCEIFASCNEY